MISTSTYVLYTRLSVRTFSNTHDIPHLVILRIFLKTVSKTITSPLVLLRVDLLKSEVEEEAELYSIFRIPPGVGYRRANV